MSASTLNYDYLCKILLIGANQVGKSVLLSRFADNTFTTSYLRTIGVDFKIKSNFNVNDKNIKLQIWDTNMEFPDIMKSYYRGAHGIFIVYDITSEESFNTAKKMVLEICQQFSDKTIFLIGNKSDLEEERQVAAKTAADFALQNGIYSTETSAKNGSNVDNAFKEMTRQILDAIMQKVEAKQPAPETKGSSASSSASSDSYFNRNRFPLLGSVAAGGLGSGVSSFLLTTAPGWAPFAIGGGIFLLFNLVIFVRDRMLNARNRNAVGRAGDATAETPSGDPTGRTQSQRLARQFSRGPESKSGHRQNPTDNKSNSSSPITVYVRTDNTTATFTLSPEDKIEGIYLLAYYSKDILHLNGDNFNDFCQKNLLSFNGQSLNPSSTNTLRSLGITNKTTLRHQSITPPQQHSYEGPSSRPG